MTWLARITWGFAGATLAVYLIMVLWSLPLIAAEAGGRLPFDLRPFGYGLEEARAFLSALSETGRSQYLGAQHMLDRLFPPLLAVTQVLSFWQTFRPRPALGLAALALAAGWVDLRENLAVAELLARGPGGIDAEITGRAAALTVAKSLLAAVVLTAWLFGLGRRLWVRA